MQKSLFATALAAVLPYPAAHSAETLDDRLESAERRLHYLESRIQDQDSTIGRKADVDSGFNRLEVSGLIEVEAGFENPESGNSSSSLTLATAELGLGAQITERLSGEIVLLYEDDGETELDVDVAAITLVPGEHWSLTAGQFYLPFGVYETQMVSDPLTLELGEIRETAAQAVFRGGGFALSAYLFDGDAREEASPKIDNFGLDLGFDHDSGAFSLSAHLGYVNDLGDSDGLIDYAGEQHDRVAGAAASLLLARGPVTLIGEYLGALDAFDSGEEPSAWNLEAGYGFALAGRAAGFALGLQGTDDAEGVGVPEEVVIATLAVEVTENTTLAVEGARVEDYAGERTGLLTLQLAAEF